MILALTRQVSPSINHCALTHVRRQPIDLALARRQHQAYENALAALGCRIQRLPPAPDLPDAVFIEDTAVVFDELAVIAYPGTPARRPETASTAAALKIYRPLAYIQPPGTLEGGDVLVVGKTIYTGLSSRTNQAGCDQLQRLVSPHGYQVLPVPLSDCLHLKSAVTLVAPDCVLLNPAWVNPEAFQGLEKISVDAQEPFAANALLVNGQVIYPAAFPATRRKLARRGIALYDVDVSELAKAEGAVTCCSLLLTV